MKNWPCLIIWLLVSACSNKPVENTPVPTEQSAPTDSLQGTWGLTHYLDSAVTHKTIAPYRLAQPAWFGILIEIDNETIALQGSIVHGKIQRNRTSDTIATVDLYGKWALMAAGNTLYLKQYPGQEPVDTTVYIYRKRPDFNMQEYRAFNQTITRYFNREMFVGKYLNRKTKDTVEFTPDGQMLGWKPFTDYEVDNYFGTSHPFQNRDVVIIRNAQTVQFWNWKFTGTVLHLTRFEPSEDLDSYGLGKEKIQLQKID